MTDTRIPPDLTLPRVLVITCACLKGGVGKTTTAFFLAVFFAVVLGLRVLYIDADPSSQTGYSWHRQLRREGVDMPFAMKPLPTPKIGYELEDLVASGEYQVIIVDVGGDSPDILKGAVPFTDELVLVTSCNDADRKRIPATYTAASQAVDEHGSGDPRVRVLLTQVPTNAMRGGKNYSTEYRRAVAALEGAGYELFDAYASDVKWLREAAEGEDGAAENPLHDLSSYSDIGWELVAPYRAGFAEVAV